MSDELKAIKERCVALWRIAHYESLENPKEAMKIDKQAIELANSIGLNYGDFDHEECTAEPTDADRKLIG